MQFLSISDLNTWALAGVAVAVVFAILLIIVLILGIFTAVAKKTNAKVQQVQVNRAENKQAKAIEKAGDDEKTAVAMALFLYFNEKENRENRVLTIVNNPNTSWGARLNPRF